MTHCVVCCIAQVDSTNTYMVTLYTNTYMVTLYSKRDIWEKDKLSRDLSCLSSISVTLGFVVRSYQCVTRGCHWYCPEAYGVTGLTLGAVTTENPHARIL